MIWNWLLCHRLVNELFISKTTIYTGLKENMENSTGHQPRRFSKVKRNEVSIWTYILL